MGLVRKIQADDISRRFHEQVDQTAIIALDHGDGAIHFPGDPAFAASCGRSVIKGGWITNRQA
jgi:hypothetical protein